MIIDIPKVGQIDFPDTMSESEINAASKRLYDEANIPEKSTLQRVGEIATRGAAQTIPGAMAGGAIAGPPGALVGSMALPIGDALNSLINMISGGVNKVTGTNIGQLQMPSQVASQYLTRAGLAEPQSTGERMIEAGAGGISSTLAQLPALMKLGAQAVSPVTREVSKRLAEAPGTQTAISAPAAAVGQYVTEATGSPLAGMLAGGATGGLAGIRGRKAESAPTAAQLKDQASLAYKKSAEAGAVIKPESLEAAGNRIVNNVTSKIIIDPEVDTGAMAIIRRLQKTFDEPQTLEQLDLTRQFIRDEQAGGGRNSKFARESLKGFDDYIDSIGKKDIVAGDSAQAIGSLKTARDLWKRSNKTQIVEDLLESAELRSGNYSQSGIENSLRQRLVKLADSEDMKFFTIGEQEAIKAAAKGGKVQNVLKWMGKLSPSSVIAAGAGSYIGASMFGPAGAVIAPAVGFASKQAATKMRLNAVQNLQDMIALGRMPEADARARLVPITGLRGLLSTANQPK